MGDTGIIMAISADTTAMVSASMGMVTGIIMLESLSDAKPPYKLACIIRLAEIVSACDGTKSAVTS